MMTKKKLKVKNQSKMGDDKLLKHEIQTWLGIKDTNYATHDITNALTHAGIVRFVDHFTMLREKDIDELVVPATTRNTSHQPLSLVNKTLLKVMLRFYHSYSRKEGSPPDVLRANKSTFNAFRVTEYNPDKPFVRWFEIVKETEDPDLANWKKSTKPTRSDYKEFRDEANCILTWSCVGVAPRSTCG